MPFALQLRRTPEADAKRPLKRYASRSQESPLVLSASARTLAVMVTVFDKAFGPGGSAAVPRKAMACGDTDEESSLESLVDIAYVMVSAGSGIRGSHSCCIDVRCNMFCVALVLVEVSGAPAVYGAAHGINRGDATECFRV